MSAEAKCVRCSRQDLTCEFNIYEYPVIDIDIDTTGSSSSSTGDNRHPQVDTVKLRQLFQQTVQGDREETGSDVDDDDNDGDDDEPSTDPRRRRRGEAEEDREMRSLGSCQSCKSAKAICWMFDPNEDPHPQQPRLTRGEGKADKAVVAPSTASARLDSPANYLVSISHWDTRRSANDTKDYLFELRGPMDKLDSVRLKFRVLPLGYKIRSVNVGTTTSIDEAKKDDDESGRLGGPEPTSLTEVDVEAAAATGSVELVDGKQSGQSNVDERQRGHVRKKKRHLSPVAEEDMHTPHSRIKPRGGPVNMPNLCPKPRPTAKVQPQPTAPPLSLPGPSATDGKEETSPPPSTSDPPLVPLPISTMTKLLSSALSKLEASSEKLDKARGTGSGWGSAGSGSGESLGPLIRGICAILETTADHQSELVAQSKQRVIDGNEIERLETGLVSARKDLEDYRVEREKLNTEVERVRKMRDSAEMKEREWEELGVKVGEYWNDKISTLSSSSSSSRPGAAASGASASVNQRSGSEGGKKAGQGSGLGLAPAPSPFGNGDTNVNADTGPDEHDESIDSTHTERMEGDESPLAIKTRPGKTSVSSLKPRPPPPPPFVVRVPTPTTALTLFPFLTGRLDELVLELSGRRLVEDSLDRTKKDLESVQIDLDETRERLRQKQVEIDGKDGELKGYRTSLERKQVEITDLRKEIARFSEG